MKQTKKTLLAIILAIAAMLPTIVQAKVVKTPKLYMFGFAASFSNKDSIVHITEIQELDSIWMDTKGPILLERQQYSGQMRDYLAQHQELPHRTCIVIFNTNRSKLEKEYLKLRKTYTQPDRDGVVHYEVRYLTPSEFRFTPAEVDPAVIESATPKSKAERKAAKKAAKEEAQKQKALKKAAKKADKEARKAAKAAKKKG